MNKDSNRLVDKILWDGNNQNVTVYFIGSEICKSRFSIPSLFQLLQIQPQHDLYLTEQYFQQTLLRRIVTTLCQVFIINIPFES